MKKITTLSAQVKTLAVLFIMTFCSIKSFSQDTLHLIYHHTQNKAADTTLSHIDRWIKTLNGKHMDIRVVGYYHQPNFKPFAQERIDEMFLILNRKARELFTFGEFTAKKGKDYQRTMVDIIYSPSVSAEEAAAIAAKAKAETDAAKAAEKKKKDEEKAAKEAEKKNKAPEDKPKSKSEVAEEHVDKGGNGKENEKKGKDDTKKGKDDSKGKEKDGEDEDDADYGQASSRTYNEGATMTLEEVQYIKSAKFIIAQTGRKSIDTKLNDAVKDFWNFTTNVVQMPYDEARKIGKENKKDTSVIFSFIQVKSWFTEKHGPVTLRILRIGYALSIETGKGKILVKQFIPKIKGQEPTYIHFVFGVTCLNDLCKIMYDNKLAKSGKADEFIDLRTPELKNKTLYLGESQINKNLPHQEIPAYYTAPYNIVSDKAWEDAILQKKDVAYAMVVLFPINPKHFFHYIVDAKTGRVYFVDLNSKFTLNTGFGTNFDPTQSGFIDKSNFQRYDKGINNAIKDNQERADDKAKDAEKEKGKAEKAEQKKKEDAAKKEKAEAEKKEKAEKKQKEKEEKEKK